MRSVKWLIGRKANGSRSLRRRKNALGRKLMAKLTRRCASFSELDYALNRVGCKALIAADAFKTSH
jgi:hypothetical protein